MHIHWWHVSILILNGILIYAVANVLVRASRRRAGKLSPFDYVFLVLLGAIGGRVTIGADVSVQAGIIVLLTIGACDAVAALLAFRSKTAERLLDGRPSLLVHNGEILTEQMALNRVTREQLFKAMRESGCYDVLDIRYAILESTGGITVQRKQPTHERKHRSKLSLSMERLPVDASAMQRQNNRAA